MHGSEFDAKAKPRIRASSKCSFASISFHPQQTREISSKRPRTPTARTWPPMTSAMPPEAHRLEPRKNQWDEGPPTFQESHKGTGTPEFGDKQGGTANDKAVRRVSARAGAARAGGARASAAQADGQRGPTVVDGQKVHPASVAVSGPHVCRPLGRHRFRTRRLHIRHALRSFRKVGGLHVAGHTRLGPNSTRVGQC